MEAVSWLALGVLRGKTGEERLSSSFWGLLLSALLTGDPTSPSLWVLDPSPPLVNVGVSRASESSGPLGEAALPLVGVLDPWSWSPGEIGAFSMVLPTDVLGGVRGAPGRPKPGKPKVLHWANMSSLKRPSAAGSRPAGAPGKRGCRPPGLPSPGKFPVAPKKIKCSSSTLLESILQGYHSVMVIHKGQRKTFYLTRGLVSLIIADIGNAVEVFYKVKVENGQ